MERTYSVETYGCQMNVHDSERIAGLLDEAGYVPVRDGEQADIVVFNTCAVRENADNKLYGNLSFLAPIKKLNPGMQIAVGGCLAQKDQSIILKKAPYVDSIQSMRPGHLCYRLCTSIHSNHPAPSLVRGLDDVRKLSPTVFHS